MVLERVMQFNMVLYEMHTESAEALIFVANVTGMSQ